MIYFRRILVGFWICFTLAVFAGCSPVKYLFVDSSGIMSYNRHTGQFEVLWEHKSERTDYPKDDSLRNSQKAQNDSVAFHVEP